MHLEALTRQFARIGADLEIVERPFVRGRNGATNFSLDIQEEGRKEFYMLEIAKPAIETIDFQVLNARVDLRHLVLMAKNVSGEVVSKEKFLCGHDERHWFVAGLPETGVTDVRTAMEALKPRAAHFAQLRAGVKAKNRNKRHNAGFIRQGEWFFIPEPNFLQHPQDEILKNERLSRGAGSKPHIVAEMLQRGGQRVYVNWRTQVTINAAQYEHRLQRGKLGDPKVWHPQWMTSEVLVRGTVRHSDHKTITLKGWHRVVMNAEPSSNNLRFLD
jgi:hypothetical protein